MLNIPASFKNNGEDYITLPVIQRFIKDNKINCLTLTRREKYLDKIIEFGNECEENKDIVLNWIDNTIQEGIKDIHIRYAHLSNKMEVLKNNMDEFNRYLRSYVKIGCSKHICENTYGKDFSLINIKIIDSKIGKKILFTFCKRLYSYDEKQKYAKAIDYPVIAEYFVDRNWLLIKVKPKSNLYAYSEEGFDIEKNDSTTSDKQINEIYEKVSKILEFEKLDTYTESLNLKNQIFRLLDKYTTTPIEIDEIMSKSKDKISNISKIIDEICNVNDKCSIPQSMFQDVHDDIKNIVEKYLSINWNNKDIFMKDRDAYPIKLSATDEEESKVEQTAAALEPLQTKVLFFDNKKMLYKNKRCDGIVFMWKRTEQLAGQKENFKVKISVKPKGLCIFKFTEYTAKEDIENVIFSVIGIGKDS